MKIIFAVRVPTNPCSPSPCGPNSVCRVINEQAVCSCLPGYFGSPPTCKPECTTTSDCALNKACINQKCIDPCPGTCGIAANCQVVSHNPICSCPPKYTGDPFIKCQIISKHNYHCPDLRYSKKNLFTVEPPNVTITQNPCIPSPCGLNSRCEVTPSGTSKCTCLPTYIGSPPNCRPECTTNIDCRKDLACINRKCADPCPGSCGVNAECTVINHVPSCTCINGYMGDPFTLCRQLPRKKSVV